MYPIDSHYQAPKEHLLSGREDSLANERFFQQITCIDLRTQASSLPTDTTVMIGFYCDEGVERNLGRVGAALGPDALLSAFAKLPAHMDFKLAFVGGIRCIDTDLVAAQIALGQLVAHFQARGHRTIVLGGGHEVAYGHYLGLRAAHPRLAIVNFDAHFDLRSDTFGPSSGTPFLQIAKDKQARKQAFDYHCIGIQPSANTRSLYQTASQLNVNMLSAEQVQNAPLETQFNFIDALIALDNPIYLTLCLDVLDAAYAPGVSAPQPMGLSPNQVLRLAKRIKQSGKVVSLDIAELAPSLDDNGRTARVAALMLSELLHTAT